MLQHVMRLSTKYLNDSTRCDLSVVSVLHVFIFTLYLKPTGNVLKF